MSGFLVVTGASRGIGAAVARQAAGMGFAVCINYLNAADRAEAVAEDIRNAGGVAMTYRADTADETQVGAMFKAVGAELGRLSGLVNNAGLTGAFSRVDELETATLRRVVDVNVLGYFFCAREAVRRMSTAHGGDGGVIVNVSSAASWIGSPGEYVHYAATKGATDVLTIGLAREVAAEGIRVNAVSPGLIETAIHAAGGRPDRVAELSDRVPMGRGGSADEVAEAVCWLLSEASGYTTGAVLPVTGGR